ncbi:MAG: hypothetical protein GY795_24725 [Desulfobacterales bacterium]|nr:hypothetical protein [Desulfobacterales bacterium]
MNHNGIWETHGQISDLWPDTLIGDSNLWGNVSAMYYRDGKLMVFSDKASMWEVTAY